jgi:ABC-type Fe3+ transport system permease subunit
MSSTAILLWTSLRTFIITVIALIISYFCARFFRTRFRYKTVAWVIFLAPITVPPLALGYIYSGPILSFIQNKLFNNILYSIIMIIRDVPFATLLLFLFPLQSRESNYLFHLSQKTKGRFSTCYQILRSDKFSLLAAFSVLFILIFNEFEIASLMGVSHWTVSLFDTQVQGVSTWNLMVQACYPVLVIFIGLTLFLFSLKAFKHRGIEGECVATQQESLFFLSYLFVALFINVIAIFLVITPALWKSFFIIFTEPWVQKEWMFNTLFGGSSAIFSYIIAQYFIDKIISNKNRLIKYGILFLFIPGGIGALPLTLFVLYWIQNSWLHIFYNTPLPHLFVLTALLLPYALLFVMIFRLVKKDGESLFTAQLIGTSRLGMKQMRSIVWELSIKYHIYIIFILFLIGYFDVTVSSLLGMLGMDTLTVRLYNLMHYGNSIRLSGMLLYFMITPFVLLSILYFVIKKIWIFWGVKSESK